MSNEFQFQLGTQLVLFTLGNRFARKRQTILSFLSMFMTRRLLVVLISILPFRTYICRYTRILVERSKIKKKSYYKILTKHVICIPKRQIRKEQWYFLMLLLQKNIRWISLAPFIFGCTIKSFSATEREQENKRTEENEIIARHEIE